MVARFAGVMMELNSASGNMKKSDGQAVDAKNASNPQGALLHKKITCLATMTSNIKLRRLVSIRGSDQHLLLVPNTEVQELCFSFSET